jgi:hypothetical protein
MVEAIVLYTDFNFGSAAEEINRTPHHLVSNGWITDELNVCEIACRSRYFSCPRGHNSGKVLPGKQPFNKPTLSCES